MSRETADRIELLRVFSDALMERTNAKVQLHTDWDFDQLVAVLANPHIALAAYQQLRDKTRVPPPRFHGRNSYESCPDCFTALLVPDARPESHYILRCADWCGFWCPDLDRAPRFACPDCNRDQCALFTVPLRIGSREPFSWTSYCPTCNRHHRRQEPDALPPTELPPVFEAFTSITLPQTTLRRLASTFREGESLSDRRSLNSVVQTQASGWRMPGEPLDPTVPSPAAQERQRYTASVGAPTLRYRNAEDGLELDFQLRCFTCGNANTSLLPNFTLQCHVCSHGRHQLRAFGRSVREGLSRAMDHRDDCESTEVIAVVHPNGRVTPRCTNCNRNVRLRHPIHLEANSDGIRLRDPSHRERAHQRDLVFDPGTSLLDDAPLTGLAPERAVYEEFTAAPGRFYSDPQMDITASLNVENCPVCRGRCYLLQSGEKACLNCGRTSLIDGTGFKTRQPRDLDTDGHTRACTSSELSVQVHPASQGVALAHFDCRGCGATVNSAGRIALQLVREGTSQRWSLAAIGRGPSVGQS